MYSQVLVIGLQREREQRDKFQDALYIKKKWVDSGLVEGQDFIVIGDEKNGVEEEDISAALTGKTTDYTHIHYLAHGAKVRLKEDNQIDHIMCLSRKKRRTSQLIEMNSNIPGVRHIFSCYVGAARYKGNVSVLLHGPEDYSAYKYTSSNSIAEFGIFHNALLGKGIKINAKMAYMFFSMISPETVSLLEVGKDRETSYCPEKYTQDSKVVFSMKDQEKLLSAEEKKSIESYIKENNKAHLEKYKKILVFQHIIMGNKGYIEDYLENGNTPNLRMRHVQSLIVVSMGKGHFDIAMLLLNSKDFKVNKKDKKALLYRLIKIVREERAEDKKIIVEVFRILALSLKDSINEEVSFGGSTTTLLSEVVLSRDIILFEALCKSTDLDINKESINKFPLLQILAARLINLENRKDEDVAMFKMISSCEKISFSNDYLDHNMLLYFCSEMKCSNAVDKLLQHKDKITEEGIMQSYNVAKEAGHKEIIELLEKHLPQKSFVNKISNAPQNVLDKY